MINKLVIKPAFFEDNTNKIKVQCWNFKYRIQYIIYFSFSIIYSILAILNLRYAQGGMQNAKFNWKFLFVGTQMPNGWEPLLCKDHVASLVNVFTGMKYTTDNKSMFFLGIYRKVHNLLYVKVAIREIENFCNNQFVIY